MIHRDFGKKCLKASCLFFIFVLLICVSHLTNRTTFSFLRSGTAHVVPKIALADPLKLPPPPPLGNGVADADAETSIHTVNSTQPIHPATRNETKLRSIIYLQNQPIGTIMLLCPNGICDLVPPERATTDMESNASAPAAPSSSQSTICPNVNGPMVIRQEGQSMFHLFVSGHSGVTNIRRFEATSPEGPWHEATGLGIPSSFPNCAPGFHSPDILDFNGTYYMFPHVHSCQGDIGGNTQPTVVLTSNDLVHWELPAAAAAAPTTTTTLYAAKNYFYMRVFVHENLFYAIAKSQENSVGSMVLLRSKSPLGPFEFVKTFAAGVRHVSLHRKGAILFVFFTIIGDMPERILLGTIHLDTAAINMRLYPGPIILEPPHSNVTLVPSQSGAALCESAPQLRDPFFFPDRDENADDLRGILFFSDRELTIGAARLHVNLTQYFQAVQYRNTTLVDSLIYESSSLSVQSNASEVPLLITGVGRSGTTFVCDLLTNHLGWNISHDNSQDCGPFPGTFGASSWYHAFKFLPLEPYGIPRIQAKQVVHLVRHPLATVKSRLSRTRVFGPEFFYGIVRMWEENNFDDPLLGNRSKELLPSVVLRHWVHRNSFISKHAQWRVRIEDVSSDAIHTWMLCMEVGRNDCPRLDVIRPILESMDHSINTHGKLEDSDLDHMTWWQRMEEEDRDAVRMALKMASEYGYELEPNVEKLFQVSTVNYTCQFRNHEAARSGLELPQKWGCSLA